MEHEATHALPYLKQALIFLVAAGVVGPVLQRLGLNSILGYLVAGVAIGPFGVTTMATDVFGVPIEMFTVSEQEGVSSIAELGVVFLLFIIGLELSGPRLWAMRHLMFGLGGAQVVVTSAVLATLGHLLGLPLSAAIAVGVALALSSTAIVVQLLVQEGRLASPPGQVMFAILLMQDIAVVPVLLVIQSLAPGTRDIWVSLVASIAIAAVLVPGILLVGRRIVSPVFRFVGARRDRDMFTAAALLVIIGTAAATSLAGLSMALGAFLAGLMFADTEFAHQLEAEIAPFKGLLLGLFFMSVGMTIDPRVVVQSPLTLLALVVGIMAVKAAIIFVFALVARQRLPVAAEAGLMLSQVGEFSLVALALATTLGVVPGDVARVLVVAAGVSMTLTSAFARPVRRFAAHLETRAHARIDTTLSESAGEGHVIIGGFGRIGRAIGDMLEERRVPYLALDLDPHSVARARKNGQPVHFGDLRRADVLENARASTARAIVLTMNSPHATTGMLAALRRNGVGTPVVARARDKAHARELYALGADFVVLEAFEASLQMGEETLVSLGFPREAAHAMISEDREQGMRDLADAALSRRR